MTEEKTAEVKTETDGSKSKFKSRKFVIWIVATLIELVAVLMAFVLKSDNFVSLFTHWWGVITVSYIGGNVAQDFAFKKG